MGKKKVQVIWFPFNRTGKARVWVIRSILLRLFIMLIFICMLAIPFFQFDHVVLINRIQNLESKNALLQEQINALQYVQQSLDRIEEKDRLLRDFFGMQEYHSLQQIIGLGGDHQEKLPGRESDKKQMAATASDDAAPQASRGLQDKMEMLLKRLASNYDIFNYLAKKQDEIWSETPSIMPLDNNHFTVTSGFGWRLNPFTRLREFHTGLDVVGPEGTKIVAPAKAVVIAATHDMWLGNYVVLDHGKNLKTVYGHLDKLFIKEGVKVKRGDALGLMGNTGLSTSRHLHYMVILNDRVIDPKQYILNLQSLSG